MNHKIDDNDLAHLEKRYGKITGWIPGAVDQKIGKINPQVTQAYLGGNTFASVFHVKPVYYETYTGAWRPLSEVTVHHGNHKIEFNKDWWKVHPRYMAWLEKRMQLINGKLLIPSLFQDVVSPYNGIIRELHQSLVPLKVGLTTSTFYPDPDPETTTIDGQVGSYGAGTTWKNIHDATSSATYANGTTDSAGATVQIIVDDNSGYRIIRGFFLFDTSSIPDTDTIDSGTISFYSGAKGSTPDQSIGVVQSNPASNTNLVATDYDNFSSIHTDTLGATAKLISSGWATAAYNDYTLNATGLSWITKTGVSKYGIRASYDYNETSSHSNPPVSFSSYVNISSADTSGTSSDPKLVVVHSAPASTFIPRISFIM